MTMMLELACPRCHQPLETDGDEMVCAVLGCGMEGFRHGSIGGIPVVIDYERSVVRDGDVEAWDGTGGVDRARGRLWRWARGTLMGVNATPAYLERFASEARRRCGRARVLVIGGGAPSPGMHVFGDGTFGVTNLDIYGSPSVDVVSDAHSIPFPDGSFDAVVLQSVLEHVLSPWQVVAEVHRVLTTDGTVLTDTPFLIPVHEAAYDFTRFTHSGLRYLFRDFEEIESGASAGVGMQVLWTLGHVTGAVTRRHTIGKLVKAAFFWLRWLDRVLPAGESLDGAAACYFVGRRSDVALPPAAMVHYYRGAQ